MSDIVKAAHPVCPECRFSLTLPWIDDDLPGGGPPRLVHVDAKHHDIYVGSTFISSFDIPERNGEAA